MFTKKLLQAMALLWIAGTMTSCDNRITEDDIAKENYTLSFVKTFGLIDPNQDWNLAQSTTVSVDAGEGAHSVKIYCKMGEKYYKVADLTNVSGKLEVPVDIPETCTSLKIKIDGKSYYTDINGGDRSRSIQSSATSGDYALSVTDNGWVLFNGQQVSPITSTGEWSEYYSLNTNSWIYNTKNANGLLPEIGDSKDPATPWGNQRNTDEYHENKAINLDFIIDAGANGQFTMQPMFWYTSQTHDLGLYPVAAVTEGSETKYYPIDTDGNVLTPDATNNYTNAGWDAKMVKLKFFTDDENEIQTYTKTGDGSTLYDFSYKNGTISGTQPSFMTEADYQTFYTSLVNTLNPKGYSSASANAVALDDVETTINTFLTTNYPDYEFVKANSEIYTWAYNDYQFKLSFRAKSNIPYAIDPTGVPENDTKWVNAGRQPAYSVSAPSLNRSKQITVSITKNGLPYTGYFGMFIEFSGTTLYSQTPLNASIVTPSSEVPTTYAASYQHPTTGRIYFSFEDWTGLSGDMDLNDLIFVLTDVKKLQGTSEITGDSSGGSNDDSGEGGESGSDEGGEGGSGEGEESGSGEDPDEEDADVMSWIIATEDLGSTDDFDFNDIVVAMQVVTKNDDEDFYREVRVQALAAGGTLPVWLHYNNGTEDYILGPTGAVKTDGIADNVAALAYEWHMWFDNNGFTSMINTDHGKTVRTPSHIVLTSSSSVAADGSIEAGIVDAILADNFHVAQYSVDANNRIQGFYFTVNTYAAGSQMTNVSNVDCRTLSAAEKGSAPQMFLIPDVGDGANGWMWPKEREHIMDAYLQFKSWVGNSAEAANWYLTPTQDIVTRPVSIQGTTQN